MNDIITLLPSLADLWPYWLGAALSIAAYVISEVCFP